MGALFPTIAMLAVLTVAAMSTHSVSVLAPEAAPAIGVVPTYIGAFVSITFASAMLSGAVTGTFVSRYGAIRVCQISVLAAAVGMGALALASVPMAVLSAVLLGVAHGPFNPASAHVLIRVSTPQWRPLIFSIKQTGVPVGGALAGALAPTLVIFIGWKGAALAVGVFALAVLVLLQPLRRSFDADRNPGHRLSSISVMTPLRLVFSHRGLRALALSAFAYAGCQLSVGGFFVVYLTAAVGMPLVLAGLVFAFLQIAGICGRVLLGAVSGRLVPARQILVMLGLIIALGLVMMALITPQWPLVFIIAVAVVLGASSLGWNGVNLAEIVARAPEGKISDATGGVQFVMFAGIVVVPPLFGMTVNLIESYAVAFFLLALLAVAGSLYLASTPQTAVPAVDSGEGTARP
jgi:predicted MFS family arabinose efflux permease